MRDRASLILFIFLVLLIIVLAQNGMLGVLLDNLTNAFSGSNQPLLPTVRPLVFSTTVPTAVPGVRVFPTQVLPTFYAPTAYAPSNAGSVPPTAVPQQNVPFVTPTAAVSVSGVVAAGGQCIVPNGWVAYTVQSGETLAEIATNFNLSVEELAAANCLQNPDLIYEGQILAVPAS